MFDQLVSLMADAGIKVRQSERDYRPSFSLPGFTTKILKPRNVVSMLVAEARDVGFAGADWVREMNATLIPLLDTGLNPVRLVAAAPEQFLVDGKLPNRPLVIASEYTEISKRWITDQGLDATVLTTFGATEVFPPEDADCIIDNTATGSTLRANNLAIVDEIMTSSTMLYANEKALDNLVFRERIEVLVMLLQSVLDARERVMLDLNVSRDNLAKVIDCLPCMREPTVSSLRNESWFAIRAAVKRSELLKLIPVLKQHGACDIVTSSPAQIIP